MSHSYLCRRWWTPCQEPQHSQFKGFVDKARPSDPLVQVPVGRERQVHRSLNHAGKNLVIDRPSVKNAPSQKPNSWV